MTGEGAVDDEQVLALSNHRAQSPRFVNALDLVTVVSGRGGLMESKQPSAQSRGDPQVERLLRFAPTMPARTKRPRAMTSIIAAR